PRVSVSPATPGATPRLAAESTRNVPSEPALAAAKATATPTTTRAPVARWGAVRAGPARTPVVCAGAAGASASVASAAAAAAANAQRHPMVRATAGTEAPA